MEEKKIKTLRQIVYMMIAIMLFEIVVLALALHGTSLLVWAALGVIAVVAIYMTGIMLQLIKYIQKISNNK